ncbi:MAG: FtsH protease activity modulator HflK [Hyphomicrobiaceae bacterium]
MPWNNQSGGGGNNGGPWGNKGGGGPWGQGPSGGGNNQTPDLEELLKRSQDKLKKVMPGGGQGGVPGSVILLLGALATALIGFWAFTFRVNPDEVGIVMRFGQYVRRADPGLHFRWPPPVEEVHFPKITRQNTLQIGMRTNDRSRGYGTTGSVSDTSTLILTGDENIVDINFVVRWQIKGESVQDYLFNIQNPELTVEEVAESAMREVVGKMNIQPILTEARLKIEQDVQKLMQTVLDSYGAGVRIFEVQLQRVDPPQDVIDAFRDVQAARADKERLQNDAFTYANKIVPEARGEAERILQAAEGYKTQTVAEASGQAARFVKVLDEYKKAPEVTRQRLYLETMERVMSQSETIILDQKGGQGVVPFMTLDQLQPKKKEGN